MPSIIFVLDRVGMLKEIQHHQNPACGEEIGVVHLNLHDPELLCERAFDEGCSS